MQGESGLLEVAERQEHSEPGAKVLKLSDPA